MSRFGALWLVCCLGGCGAPAPGVSQFDAAPQPTCALIPEPPGCGDRCGSDADCASGTFCRGEICDAECSFSAPCPLLQVCTPQGRCQPRLVDSGVVDRDGDTVVCADIDLSLARIVPNIMVLLDRSGSMDQRFGTQSRYDAARGFLSGPDGVLRRLQSVARFSMTLYDKDRSGSCPNIDQVALALNNANAIDQLLSRNGPRGSTPTAQAIELLRQQVRASRPDSPLVLVLITDGIPNGCGGSGANQTEQQRSVQAVEAFWNDGVPTFVVGINLNTDHLRDLARAGAGGQNAPVWTPDNPAALQAAFDEIISRQIPCQVMVDQPLVPDLACDGDVRINDEALACNNTTRGWRVVDANTIELLGSACDQLRSGEDVRLTGHFPCEVIVP